MKFTTPIAMIDPSFYIPLARAAEEAGFDSIAVPDSIAYPQQSSSKYPYNPDGTREFLENKPFIEPMTAIAAMGVGHRAHRVPHLRAQDADAPPGGAGEGGDVGRGAHRQPPRARRRARARGPTTTRSSGCRGSDGVGGSTSASTSSAGLGRAGTSSTEGEFYDFPPIKLNPIPTRPIPILIGGHSDANLRRAARRCDGWMAAGGSPEDLTGWIARIQELRREYGREQEPFDIYATSFDSFSADGIKRLEDLGVTHTSRRVRALQPVRRWRPTPRPSRRRSTTCAATPTT